MEQKNAVSLENMQVKLKWKTSEMESENHLMLGQI